MYEKNKTKWLSSNEKRLLSAIAIFAVIVIVLLLSWLSDREERCTECMQRIQHVKYEGHSYLVYNSGYKFGICHDENCKCKNISEENNKSYTTSR